MTPLAYVVDDEPLAVARMTRLLDEVGRVTLVGAATTPRDAQAFLRAHRVDLLFLDISMPVMNGFELLAELDVAPWVVFTTAHDEFVLRAFEVKALDYLLKPIAVDQLQRALDKFERIRAERQPLVDVRAVCRDVVEMLRARPVDYAERLPSRIGGRVSFVDVQRITHLYAAEKSTYAVADGKAYSLDAPLSDLERRLDPRCFVRIHRASMVNLRWVGEAHAGVGGGMLVQLKDAARTRLIVSKSRAADVRARLGM